eukprot:SAG31_NODE_3464_length_4244_cov_3.817370_2_plen_42_part_00
MACLIGMFARVLDVDERVVWRLANEAGNRTVHDVGPGAAAA